MVARGSSAGMTLSHQVMIEQCEADCFRKSVRFYWVRPCTLFYSMECVHRQNCTSVKFALGFITGHEHSLGASKSLMPRIEVQNAHYCFDKIAFVCHAVHLA